MSSLKIMIRAANTVPVHTSFSAGLQEYSYAK